MPKQACSPNTWYLCQINLPTSISYVIISLQPLDAQGQMLGKEICLPLRAGRQGQRVFYAPKHCVAVHFSALPIHGEEVAIDEAVVYMKPLSFWAARWRMRKRIRHYDFQNSRLKQVVLLIKSVVSSFTLYKLYEKTFYYKRRADFSSEIDTNQSTSVWPALQSITLKQLQSGLEINPQGWVFFHELTDQWTSGAVTKLAHCQAQHQEAKIVSFDEIHVSDVTPQMEPWLKPQWNVDLFLSSAYQGHSVIFRADLLALLLPKITLEAIVSIDELVDTLLLVLMAEYPHEYQSWITHCPVVALQVNKPVLSQAKKAHWKITRRNRILDLLKVDAAPVEAEGRLGLAWRLHWPIPNLPPLVSLCIPTRNGLEVLQPCLESILQLTRYKHFEILVIDNQSDCPQTLQYLAQISEQDKRVRVLRYDAPFNFAEISNFAVAQAQGEVIGLVNNDIEPCHAEWLEEMLAQVLRPDVGCVGAKLYYPSGTIQHGGVVLGIGGVAGHAFRFESAYSSGYQGRLGVAQNYSAVTAACLLVRKVVYAEAGGMNEQLAVNYNDVDFSLKVQSLGYRNVWTPYAELTHHESVTRGKASSRKQKRRAEKEFALMRKKWGVLLDSDPAYNPHLTLIHEDFSLR